MIQGSLLANQIPIVSLGYGRNPQQVDSEEQSIGTQARYLVSQKVLIRTTKETADLSDQVFQIVIIRSCSQIFMVRERSIPFHSIS